MVNLYSASLHTAVYFIPCQLRRGPLVRQARSELECLKRICEVWDARHRLWVSDRHYCRRQRQKLMGHVPFPKSVCRQTDPLVKILLPVSVNALTWAPSLSPFSLSRCAFSLIANPIGFTFNLLSSSTICLLCCSPQPGLSSPIVCICAVIPGLVSLQFISHTTEGAPENTNSLLAVSGGFHLP